LSLPSLGSAGASRVSSDDKESDNGGPWLVALDLDGTTLREDGSISEAVIEQIRRLDAAGHHVIIATGRSAATTIPVLKHLAISPQYLVCSNGAVTLLRDSDAQDGYRRENVSSFDPGDVLRSIRTHLPEALFAVEDIAGVYRHTAPFPDATTGLGSEQLYVTFDELLHQPATRVVAISPHHDLRDFIAAVNEMGMNQVSYAVGWTAWLDVAGHGVNKAIATERVRHLLGIQRGHVMAVGDGYNDIELLGWAAESGRGVAMGDSPAELIEAASETTGTVQEDGLAQVLATL
jgi:5-amino-6-(5-phospho-D-ribitylamino)uracil phosphatase